jgi:curved DNA-binding protein CbpA
MSGKLEPNWPAGSKPLEFKPKASTTLEVVAPPSREDLAALEAQDYYARLGGLSRDATPVDIMGAYATLASRYFKDPRAISPHPEYEIYHRLITEAYETLIDPRRRMDYNDDLAFKEHANSELANVAENVAGIFASSTDFIRAIDEVSELVLSLSKEVAHIDSIMKRVKPVIIENFTKFVADYLERFDIPSSAVMITKIIKALQFHFSLEQKELIDSIKTITFDSFAKRSTAFYQRYDPDEAFVKTDEAMYKLIDAGFDSIELHRMVHRRPQNKKE